jgi:hypothetical protein
MIAISSSLGKDYRKLARIPKRRVLSIDRGSCSGVRQEDILLPMRSTVHQPHIAHDMYTWLAYDMSSRIFQERDLQR